MVIEKNLGVVKSFVRQPLATIKGERVWEPVLRPDTGTSKTVLKLGKRERVLYENPEFLTHQIFDGRRWYTTAWSTNREGVNRPKAPWAGRLRYRRP